MSDANLICPRCQVPLRAHDLGPVSIDGCDTCGGLWFDTDELSRLAKGGQETVVAAEAVFAPPQPASDTIGAKGLCPRCQVPLYAFEFAHTPGVTLDACATCRGVWIDDGELEALGRRLAPTEPAATDKAASVRQKARQAVALLHRVPCPKCGEENPESAVNCWACGQRMGHVHSGRFCPRCDNRLEYITAEDLEIHPPPYLDHCPDCGGIWIQRDTLSPLMELSVEALKNWEARLSARLRGTLDTRETEIICPSCQIVLAERPYARDSSVFIDACRNCLGVWLDSGELVLIKQVSMQQDVWAKPTDL
jgi:uncharacterized protein